MVKRLFIALILFFSLFSCSREEKTNELPNFVFILADDLGYGELGVFGQKFIETPNIDRLAFEGVRFTNAYNTSKCFPTP